MSLRDYDRSHAVSHPRLHHLRRRQPHVRDPRRTHQVRPGRVRRRDPLRGGQWPYQGRREQRDQRLHPQSDVQRRGRAGRAGRRVPRPPGGPRSGRQGRPDAAHPVGARVLRARAPAPVDGRVRHRPIAHVAHARQPGRGATCATTPRRSMSSSTALNQWMHETWSFNYEDRIYATPVITLPIVDQAIAELEWVLERGAKVILIRPAPVPGFNGPRSFALPEFDPFWEAVQESGVVVGCTPPTAATRSTSTTGRAEAAASPALRELLGLLDDHQRRPPPHLRHGWHRSSATGSPPVSPTSASCPSRTAADGSARSSAGSSAMYDGQPQLFDEDPVAARSSAAW